MVMSSCGPAERFPVYHGDNGVMELRGNGLSYWSDGGSPRSSAPVLRCANLTPGKRLEGSYS